MMSGKPKKKVQQNKKTKSKKKTSKKKVKLTPTSQEMLQPGGRGGTTSGSGFPGYGGI